MHEQERMDEIKVEAHGRESEGRGEGRERQQYLLGLGLALEEQLEQDGGEGGVGQQGHRRGCPEEACTQRARQDPRHQNRSHNDGID